jgi:hypothetical protein
MKVRFIRKVHNNIQTGKKKKGKKNHWKSVRQNKKIQKDNNIGKCARQEIKYK